MDFLSFEDQMFQRIYIHNFRCFENFELMLKDMHSVLILGKNGVGKSTISHALEIFQSVARGVNRLGTLIGPSDFTLGRTEIPMRFELEVEIDSRLFHYTLAVELPDGFKEVRVSEECLSVDGTPVFQRNQAQVVLGPNATKFLVDWHLAALPVIQETSHNDPISQFKSWLSSMLLIAPVPDQISGIAQEKSLEPQKDCANIADWLSGLLGRHPAAYATINRFLSDVLPDLADFEFHPVGPNVEQLRTRFQDNGVAGSSRHSLTVNFDNLSSGEKCLFVCAAVLAANKYRGPLFCLWDEPDNFLALPEVGQLVMTLRKSFIESGQLIVMSHHPETIRKFSDETTIVLHRNSHVEPPIARWRSDSAAMNKGDIVESLIRGEW